MKHFIKRWAFTLPEVLLAIAIVGIISGLVMPGIITKYQNRSFDNDYKREIQSLTDTLQQLPVVEKVASFDETSIVYKTTGTSVSPVVYGQTAGKFLKKYMRVAKYCEYNQVKNCFASSYKKYNDDHSGTGFVLTGYGEDKPTSTTIYAGSCALLKNGVSICISPKQITKNNTKLIEGIIDLNGPKGPNVWGRDMRTFGPIDIKDGLSSLSVSNNLKVYDFCADPANKGTLKCQACKESDFESDSANRERCCKYVDPDHAGCCENEGDYFIGSACCNATHANSPYYSRCYTVGNSPSCYNLEEDFYYGSSCCTPEITAAAGVPSLQQICGCDPSSQTYEEGDPCCESPYVICTPAGTGGTGSGGSGSGSSGGSGEDVVPPSFDLTVTEFWTVSNGNSLKIFLTFVPSEFKPGSSKFLITSMPMFKAGSNVDYTFNINSCNNAINNISWNKVTEVMCTATTSNMNLANRASNVYNGISSLNIISYPSVALGITYNLKSINNVKFDRCNTVAECSTND